MQLVSLVGTRTIGEPETKDYIELKHVTMVGTRIIRIPKHGDDEPTTGKKEAAPEQAPPARRRGFFGRRRR